jgi:hypothetical protein
MMLGAGLIFFSAGAPIERVSNEIVGVRPATPQAQAAAVRKPEFSKLEPAKKRPVMAEAAAELFEAPEPCATPIVAPQQPWDVEVRAPAEQRSEAGTSAGLAAASKHLLGGGNRAATAVAAAAPVSVAATSTATIAERKPSLPLPPGALPTAVGTLPLCGLASSPAPLSLQEAIHAAKQSAN